jgi:hypothetical protein
MKSLTESEKQYLEELMKWQRKRNMNYATKKGMSYRDALNYLFRRSFEEQRLELDRVVDPEFHSLKEPKTKSSNRPASKSPPMLAN